MASLKEIAANELKNGLKVGTASEVMTPPEPMPSGCLVIDHVSTIGGVPRGRIVEAYGLMASGKTTFALQVAAQAQRRGEKIVYADYEAALDKVYCKALGLDVDDEETFFMMQPSHLEQGANAVERMIETGEIRLVIFDSVKSMLPLQMAEKQVGEITVAAQAKVMSEFLMKLVPKCSTYNTTAIFINHLMNTIPIPGPGGSRISRETTPGGRALKFYASQRYRFTLDNKAETSTQYEALTNSYEEIDSAHTGKIWVEKNKVGRPHLTAPYTIRYGEGFDNNASAIEILVAHGIISVSAGYHRIPAALDDVEAFERSDINKYPEYPGYCRSSDKMHVALRSASPDTQRRWFLLAQQMLERNPEIEDQIESVDPVVWLGPDPIDSFPEPDLTRPDNISSFDL